MRGLHLRMGNEGGVFGQLLIMRRTLGLMILAVSLTMLPSCLPENTVQKVPLHMNQIEIQEDGGEGLLQAMLVDEDYLLLASHGDEYVFRVFPLPLTGESFYGVREGRGPGEVQNIDYRSLSSEKDCFWFVDASGAKEGKITGQQVSITPGEHKFQQEVTLNGMVRLNEGYIDINTDGTDREFVFYHNTFANKTYVGRYPNWDKTGKMLPLFSYIKYMAANPDGNCFVASYARYPKARIFDGRGVKQKEIDLNFEKASLNPNKAYYVCKPCVNEKLIFLLSQAGEMGTDNPEVQVLDWDGNIVARYVLDCAADLFAIDFKNMMLFTCSRSEKGKICYAKLPE